MGYKVKLEIDCGGGGFEKKWDEKRRLSTEMIVERLVVKRSSKGSGGVTGGE